MTSATECLAASGLKIQQSLDWFSATRLLILLCVGLYVLKLIYGQMKPRQGHACKEPPTLPYWIPVLGHALAFLKNSEELLTLGREYFGGERHPFALNLGGSTFYAIFDPRHVSTVFNAGPSLSFDVFFKHTMHQFGSGKSAIERIFEIPAGEPHDVARPKSVNQLAHEFQVAQTSGGQLKELCQHIVGFFQENIFLEGLKSHVSPSFFLNSDGERLVSLKQWTAEVFIHAGQDAYFGRKLLDVDPGLPQVLMRMDELSWQVFYRYPRFLRPELNGLIKRLRGSLEEYFKIPQAERKSQAWFTQSLEREHRRVGLDEKEIAAQMVFLYWGINTNVSKAAYWMITHMVFEPELIEMVREETSAAFSEDGTVNVEYLASQCPHLNAIWLEVLRLSASSTALRYITEDQQLGDFILRKGRALLISARQLHYNPADFGDDAGTFDAERFLNSPQLQRSPSFRPFGGGKTLCPGRHLAKWTVLSFVAIVFRRYDVELAKPQRMPRYEECKPAIGIISGSDDVVLRLRERGC